MSSKLPFISSDIPRDLRSFLDRVRELLSGTGPERVVRAKDLISAGIATSGPAGTLIPGPPKVGPPSIPLNVSATGAIATIIITWDPPTYSGHAYAEIWTAPTDDITSAVLLAQSNSDVFSDAVGASVSRYYWVRFVNIDGLVGKFNDTDGTLGQTGDDPDYLMEVLSDAYGTTSLAPFFQIDVPTVINGVTIPAGTYIKQAFIADATISRAKIQNLAVDTAKIDDLSVTTAKIGNAQITGGKIANTTITDANILGGTITGAKIATSTISTSNLNFTVVGTSNVVGTINSSSEGIRISGTKIQIDGNVTFSAGYDPTTKIVSGGAATDVNNNATTISGGKITTDTLSASVIQSNTTKTANNTAFGLGTGQQFATLPCGGQFTSSNANTWGLIVGNTAGGYGLAAGSTVTSGSASAFQAVGYANSGFTTYRFLAELGASNLAGRFRTGATQSVTVATTADLLCAHYDGSTSWAAYVQAGTIGPFTGAHDGIMDNEDAEPDVGDILVDYSLVAAPNVSDSITVVKVSTSANQKGALGVFVSRCGAAHIPASLCEYMPDSDAGGSKLRVKPEYELLLQTHYLVSVNAIGEGKVNVCGGGGDIEIGDLIVTSSIAGKGMKQSDDLVRSITVAKARENVTFSSPTEVKQIACIYLCG
jgi:hypothetical protein